MPLRDEAPIGAPCWVDIMTTDPAKAHAFYTELFGWTVDDPGPDYGGYTNFHRDGVPVAGCMGHTGDGPANIWSIYLATDDAEKTCEVAAAHGGMVMFPPMVLATPTPMNAPPKLQTAARSTAVRGGSTPVDTTVATALAVSWKPFT